MEKKILNKKPEIINLEKLNKICNETNKTIGVTTGCFDIFHCGHLQSIKYCFNNCDLLVVLLNSDISIKKLKGDKRPINKLKYRLDLLENLPFIDYILIFDDKDADNLLRKIDFDIFFKGGDYDINKLQKIIPNKKIILTPFVSGTSSTNIINKIKNDL